MLLKIIKENVDRLGPEKKFLVACSGGLDSMALVSLFSKTVPQKNLYVVSIDHGVRKESKSEAKKVIDFWRKKGISGEVISFNGLQFNEDILRRERYKALEKIRQERKFDFIVTAHHLDDQVETVLLKLIRGTGPTKVWGMKSLSEHILRPLLAVKKRDLEEYAASENLMYFNDPSNKNTDLNRNYLRNIIIPKLRKVNQKASENIARSVRLGQDLREYIEKEVARELEEATKNGRLDTLKWGKLHEYMKNEVLIAFLKKTGLKERDLTEKNILEFKRVLKLSGTKKISIGRMSFLKEHDSFGIEISPVDIPQKKSLKLEKPVIWGDKIILMSQKTGASRKNNILISKEMAYNLSVRVPKPFDKIRTKQGTKKLSDLFCDAKIPRAKRTSWPVIVSNKTIIWVPGLAATEKSIKAHKKKGVIVEIKDAKTE